MSHDILENDIHEGIVQAWHGLTVVRPDLSLHNCQFANWEFVPSPMFTENGQELPWQFLSSNDKPGAVFGKAFDPSTFSVFSNAELLAVFGELEEFGAKLESVLTIRNRSVRVMTFELGESFKAAGRETKRNLIVSDAIDGTGTAKVYGSGTTVVCGNTHRVAEFNRTKDDTLASVKHTKNGRARLSGIPSVLAKFYASTKAYAAKLDRAAEIDCSAEQARGFFAAFLTGDLRLSDSTLTLQAPEGLKLSRRSVNRVDAMVDLFRNGAGNDGNDVSDLFNGATDYFTHASAGGDDKWKQFESSEFGSGATEKRYFYDVMPEDMISLASIAEQGNRVYETSLKELNA